MLKDSAMQGDVHLTSSHFSTAAAARHTREASGCRAYGGSCEPLVSWPRTQESMMWSPLFLACLGPKQWAVPRDSSDDTWVPAPGGVVIEGRDRRLHVFAYP